MITIMKIKVWCRWMNENEQRTKMGKLGLSPERCRQDAVLFLILYASGGLLHKELLLKS